MVLKQRLATTLTKCWKWPSKTEKKDFVSHFDFFYSSLY